MESGPPYGTARTRQANVSYLEMERAALSLLADGRRPSVEIIRKALGRGSPATIAEALKRFWRDLGIRAAGDPAALSRLPAEIADLADGVWQRALALAGQAARNGDNAARERLAQLQTENEIRAQSHAAREKEFDTASREREKALAETREQVSSLMKELAVDRETMRAQVARIIQLSGQVEDYQRQLTTLVTRAVVKHRVQANTPAVRRHSSKRSRRPTPRQALKTPKRSKRKLARKAR